MEQPYCTKDSTRDVQCFLNHHQETEQHQEGMVAKREI